MKAIVFFFVLALSGLGCKQYTPVAGRASEISAPNRTSPTLAPAKCSKNQLVHKIQESSTVSWSFEGEKGGVPTRFSGRTQAMGQMEFPVAQLTKASGRADFNIAAMSTGDPIHDRLFQEVLFASSNLEAFRFVLKKLVGKAMTVPKGTTVEMKADGNLELGGRRAGIIMPVKISELDGNYTLLGSISVNTSTSQPGINSIALRDKIKIIEDTLNAKLGETMQLEFAIQLKDNCMPQP